MVHEDLHRAGASDTTSADRNLFDDIGGGQARHHYLGVLGNVANRGAARRAKADEVIDRRRVAVEYRHRKATLNQVPGHGFPHSAQADKTKCRHAVSPCVVACR
ncbi:protein of unknown function (plasmid) [Cupriavidus taiwanensis]|nr:protein of unknown function [Cupriavidus taiwanensis]